MAYEVHVIHTGYYYFGDEDKLQAKCTCTLIKGKTNVIVNTMAIWDSEIVIEGLNKLGLELKDVKYVVSTNGSSSFTGNNHLFIESYHIVGQSLQQYTQFLTEELSKGHPLKIDGDDLKIVPTPGNTLNDVSVLVKTAKGIVAVVGGLFIKEEDIENDGCWLATRSEHSILQRYNRSVILNMAYMIIPGYGGQFVVTEQMKRSINRHRIPFHIDLEMLKGVSI